MTEEIKEILDRLQNSVNYSKIDIPTFDGSDSEYIDNDTLLEPSKCKLLLNYITNLQKENDYYNKKNIELSELNTSLRSDRDNYKQRNEKAVEYIKNHTENIDRGTYYEDYVETYDLLNILQGGDE